MSIAKNGGTRLTIRMCDRDVIDRVNSMFPCTTIQVVVPKPMKDYFNQPMTQYAWRISNPETVREVLTLLLPWFGERRAAKAREVLAHLETRPGIGGFQRNKTHCKEGHPYNKANTRITKGGYRKCRICSSEWEANYRARRAASES